MGFDFAKAKETARRVVHDTLGVLAHYEDDSIGGPYEIRARWHTRIVRQGDLENGGYAEIIEGIDRIVLFPADTPSIEFIVGGTITFPSTGRSFRLILQEPTDGPLGVVWQVSGE